jgi:hypothetical protein
VIAEVYTLHAAIVAGVLLSLLAWRQTRRQRWFFAAIAVFAAALGNHTTIVALATAPTDPPREPRSRAGDVYAASRATLAALRWTRLQRREHEGDVRAWSRGALSQTCLSLGPSPAAPKC